MDIGTSANKHLNLIKRAFLGSRIFDGEKRTLFKQEILETSRKRSHVTLYLILGIQIINILFNLNTMQHSTHLEEVRHGTLIITSICIIYAFLFLYTRFSKKKSYYFTSFVVKSFWALILISSFWFSLANFAEGQPVAYNITLFIFGLGIIPILSLPEILTYLVIYMVVNFIIGAQFNIPSYLMQQIVILNIISVYASQTQYISAVKVYTEREHLSDKNVRLEKLSETDPLTGLLNRRGLESHIAGFDSYYTYSRKYLCVLMISIDQRIDRGDKFLRQTGDDCIVKVADCTKTFFTQKTDAVAYFGNGEFLVITDTKNEGAIALALNIKRAVEALELRLDEKLPFTTVSIGAAVPGSGDLTEENVNPLNELINAADQQLYNAISCGRNCVSSGEIIFR